MSLQQAVTVLLLVFLGHQTVHCTVNGTGPGDMATRRTSTANSTVNSGSSQFQVPGPAWGRNLLTSWLMTRNNSAVRLGVNNSNSTSNGNLIRQLRFTPMNAVLSSFIYSLSVVPLFLALTSVFTPKPHGFYGRRKRALVNESHLYRHLPLMNREETRRFLSLFETTLLVSRKIQNEQCKKYYYCKVFKSAVRSGSLPKITDFEYALLNVFGIVAERYDYKVDLIPTVKMYYEIATNAFKGISCSQSYPCSSDRNATVHQKISPIARTTLQLPSREGNSSKATSISAGRRHPSSRRTSPQKRAKNGA
ncbi:hypothetical protein TYRP_007931 [Tyrophagus putrescentiae]|nr:hypothetical protein TYRP_007931 [Tyrophagus putrescentiae]